MDEGDWWRTPEADSFPNFSEMDYRTVLRLINPYLPVKGLAGKALTPALLDEFCLLDPELMKLRPISEETKSLWTGTGS
jgi:hypothetical protein